MTTFHTVSFQKTVLASLIGLCLSQSVFALQEISDAGLSEATGEGIALLPENFAFQFNGADDTLGTGYIRYIPVGPLTLTSLDTNKSGGANPTAADITSADHSVGKADIYMYGLALSQSAKDYGVARTLSGTTPDTNSRFDRPITSWGSADNPWLLKVATESNVPDFSALTSTSTTTGAVSYLALEAPLYSTDVAALSAAEKSAYNLKVGMWADAFVRDPTKAEGAFDQFHLGENYGGASDSTRANRLRMQVIWDGLSVNGSNMKLFQTLGGVTPTEVTQGLSTSYNNTFGMAGVLRFNSGDGGTLRATYTDPNNGAMISSGDNAIRTIGAWVDSTTANGCGNASQNFSTQACEYRFRSRTVKDEITRAGGSTWKAPSAASVLRMSTNEANGASDAQMLTTPATGGTRPDFGVNNITNDGIYLYNPNINLVLGSLYQPLTFGASGNNITMELARIPNKASIYKQIYTAYAGAGSGVGGALTAAESADYKGSTCNFYQCGTSAIAGYQGSNATHSSITIGSTIYNAATNTLEAYKGLSAVGISFGRLQDRTVAVGFGTKNYVQWQDQQRRARERNFNWTDQYEVTNTFWSDGAGIYDPYTGAEDCNTGFFGGACPRTANNNGTTQTLGSRSVFVEKGYHFDWVYRTSGDADNPGIYTPSTDAQNTANGAYTNAQIAAGNDTDANARNYTNRAAQADNISWATRTAAAANQPNWANSTSTSALVGGFTLQNIPTNGIINTSATNNFGSAVIDGMLIQHLKFTTKGL